MVSPFFLHTIPCFTFSLPALYHYTVCCLPALTLPLPVPHLPTMHCLLPTSLHFVHMLLVVLFYFLHLHIHLHTHCYMGPLCHYTLSYFGSYLCPFLSVTHLYTLYHTHTFFTLHEPSFSSHSSTWTAHTFCTTTTRTTPTYIHTHFFSYIPSVLPLLPSYTDPIPYTVGPCTLLPPSHCTRWDTHFRSHTLVVTPTLLHFTLHLCHPTPTHTDVPAPALDTAWVTCHAYTTPAHLTGTYTCAHTATPHATAHFSAAHLLHTAPILCLLPPYCYTTFMHFTGYAFTVHDFCSYHPTFTPAPVHTWFSYTIRRTQFSVHTPGSSDTRRSFSVAFRTRITLRTFYLW